MGASSGRESVLRVLDPVVTDLGFDLEDVSLTPAGRRRVLRVVVDQDGGVGLDEVARVSSAVSAALDESDAMGPAPYVLEVTSPGIERPLTQPRHWRRNRDRLVEIALADGSSVVGRVAAADEHGLRVDVAGTPRQLPWDSVVRGVVQVEFSRPVSSPLTGPLASGE